MDNTESRGQKRLTSWFRRAKKATAGIDPRPAYYEIVNARLHEFRAYLLCDGDEGFTPETGQLLTDTFLTVDYIRSRLRFEELHKFPLETLEAVRVLIDEELPNLIQQARRARTSMDDASVEELFRQGVVAIHLGLHRLACFLDDLSKETLVRRETDAVLELRRQVAFLRLKYDGRAVRAERGRSATVSAVPEGH